MGQTLRLTLTDNGGGGNLGQWPRAPRAHGGVGRAWWESDTRVCVGHPCAHICDSSRSCLTPLVLGLFQQLGVEPTGQKALFKP